MSIEHIKKYVQLLINKNCKSQHKKNIKIKIISLPGKFRVGTELVINFLNSALLQHSSKSLLHITNDL